MDNLFVQFRVLTGEIICVLKALNRGEDLTNQKHWANAYFKLVPEVVAWMRRSAYRRGVSTALGLVLGQCPEVDLDKVTKAYAGRGVGDIEVEQLATIGAPFADRVLSLVNLDVHQGTRIAEGDPVAPKAPRDLAPREYFRAARMGELTTYITETFSLDYSRVPRYRTLTNAEKLVIATRYTPLDEDSSSDDESIPDVVEDDDPVVAEVKRQSLMQHGLRPTRNDDEASGSGAPRSHYG
jgi:hypothetical protein